MKKIFNRNVSPAQTKNSNSDLLEIFIKTEETVNGLPELSAIERVKFEHEVALDHLYYSSKIEGSNLNKERLEKAVRPQA